MKKWLLYALTIIIVLGNSGVSLFSASLVEERRYEPIVLPAYHSAIRAMAGAKVNQIYLYAWNDATAEWRLMPFQIDEQTFGPDPRNPSTKRWYYFIPPIWSEIDTINISNHNGVFDDHDELVFMVADCGAKAPARTFLEVDGEKLLPKVELKITDTTSVNSVAYAYLFTSAVKKLVPHSYEFQYFADADSVTTKYYGFGLSENGAVDDIVIKQPGGNGLDLLDKLKIRFGGVLDFAFPVVVLIKESDFYLYPEINVTEDPVVRLIRESKVTLSLGDYVLKEIAFPVKTKFYPYSGFFNGGTSLAPEDLGKLFPDAEVLMIVQGMRESWDYNQNAVGMKYYNKYNNGIVIDGLPDVINGALDIPINTWDLTTGEQGSILKITKFTEQKWGGVEVYYFDNKNGGQADSATFDYGDDPDTGDEKSFGDNGILFKNKPDQDSVTIDFDYQMYFIPKKNLNQADGARLAFVVNNPVAISRMIISSVEESSPTPETFALLNNYPNPFNGSTFIRFSTPIQSFVRLDIYDLQGRLVSNLAADYFEAGGHQVIWSGLNDNGELMPSGVYYCRLQAGDFSQTLKLLMIK